MKMAAARKRRGKPTSLPRASPEERRDSRLADGRYGLAKTRVEPAVGKQLNAKPKSIVAREPPSTLMRLMTSVGSKSDLSRTVRRGMSAESSCASCSKEPTLAAPAMNWTIGPKAEARSVHTSSRKKGKVAPRMPPNSAL